MSGIKVDSWVAIDGDCPMNFEVVGQEIQFRFGGVHDGGVDLVVSERGLANLAAKVTEALAQVRQK
ncbi:hypothetical protein [Saccharothrix stipae]